MTAENQTFAEYEAAYRAWIDAADFQALTIAQPILPADTPLGELPATLLRRCCPGKSCGNTELVLTVSAEIVDGTAVNSFGYARESNGDAYYRPVTDVSDLVKQMNNPKSWPVDEEAWDALESEQIRRINEYQERKAAEAARP